MLKKWRQARKETEEMNLLPVMNLMVILIPALMLGAAFYHLGNIATSIPDNVPATDTKPPKDVKVVMNIRITAAAISVSGAADGLSDAETAALDKTLPNLRGKRDIAQLKAHLIKVKAQYPKSDTVRILPEPRTQYFDVIAVLDASRERKLPPAEVKPGKEFVPLFPKSVLTKQLLKAPEADEAVEATTPNAGGGQ
jgi:biopolymer transport protein ExbD